MKNQKKKISGSLRIKGLTLKRKGKNVQFETTREKMIAPGTKEEILDQRCKKKGDKYCMV